MPRFRTLLLLPAAFVAVTTGFAHADGPVISLGASAPLSTLVRFEERDYRIAYDQSVSLEPLSQAAVRKIGYGRETVINVVTTASGTYSSDGLASPHFSYPGIDVTPVAEETGGIALTAHRKASGGRSSFLDLYTSPDGDFVFLATESWGFASCHFVRSFAHCFSN